MSEPTLSYNLVMDAYLNFRDAQRSGTNLEKGNARKRMVRSFAAYAVSALAGAIMESLADALRDDDDYESYLRKFWEAFWGWDGNLVSDIRISNKIPFFKDIASVFGGNTVDRMLAHGFEEKDIPGKITSAIRDLYTKDADGNTGEGRISREQAQNLLREYAGKEEKDIFWNLQVWDQILDGVEDAGKYRELYDAVSTGKNLKPTVKFYLDNGIGKDTLSQRLSDEFRETYTELYRTDRSAADSMKRNLLDAYEALGYDRKEKETTISGWVYDGELSDALESGNDKSIRSTIKSMVADGYDWQYVPGKVSSLVKALYTKDSNGELGAGRISRETAKKLLTTYADMDETDVFWALRDWDRIAAGETNVNRYDDLHQAVSSGKSIQQTVKFYLDNGIGKSTLSQNLTSTYKQQYIDLYYSDPKAASALKKRLLDAYAAMGYDRSKKAKVIDGWIADAKD